MPTALLSLPAYFLREVSWNSVVPWDLVWKEPEEDRLRQGFLNFIQ